MKTEKIQSITTTANDERLRELKALFPECVSEGAFDTEKLNTLLNNYQGGG